MTKKDDPILIRGFAIFHKHSGQLIGDVGETTSVTKRRFTKHASYSNREHKDIIVGKRFDDQPLFELHQLVNPVILNNLLQDLSDSGMSGEEVVKIIQDRVSGSCIK